MTPTKQITVDEKIKAVPIEQQCYINGLIDGALMSKKKIFISREVCKQIAQDGKSQTA